MNNIKIADRKKFFLKVVIPTFLTASMFIILIFAVIIPYFNHHLLEAKKEMIKEIVSSADCIADMHYESAIKGETSMEQARISAIQAIESIRYGTDGKDYIWITDDAPIMIMHPYKKNLIGKNVDDYKDPNGKAMFAEMVKVAKKSGEGYVDYMWQWMDDSTKIVPKISYIRQNSNWNWIIGTGVYIEDIRESISQAINNFIWISLGIFAVVSFLLIVIVRRNLNVERKNSLAEQYLKESNEKYKTLVEASYDGTLMFVDNKCIFANKKIKEIISSPILLSLQQNLESILDKSLDEDLAKINNFISSSDDSLRLETKIISMDNKPFDVLLSFSKITFSGSQGLIVIIKDLTIQENQAETDSLINEVLMNTTRQFGIGTFRTLPDRKARIVVANSNFLEMLGYDTLEEISSVGMFNIFDDSLERKEFIAIRNNKGFVKDFLCKVRKKDNTISHILVSAVDIKEKDGSIKYIDGITVDYARKKQSEQEKDLLLSSLINNASLWDLHIDSFPQKAIPFCQPDITIEKALELMNFYSTDILLAKSYSPDLVFMLTKDNILKLLGTVNFNLNSGIELFLTVPNDVLTYDTTAIDCIFNMKKNNQNFVLIRRNNDLKVIYLSDILTLFNSNRNYLSKRISQTQSIDEIIRIHKELPVYINNFVTAGTDLTIISDTITTVSDRITQIILKHSIDICGEPPCRFAFIAMGSEGRSEQGLSTDQDNAIIFEDVPEDKADAVYEYFKNLAENVNNLLAKVGYKLCDGDIMAKNPKWCQPLSVWKQYFNKWINLPEPQSLVDSSIFFDFRCVFGDNHLSDNLREYINLSISQKPAFLSQHAILTINYKLPVGMFGKIQTENKEEHSDVFNIKNAIRLLVNLIRLYAMDSLVLETNTLKRLDAIYYLHKIPESLYKEINYCFKFLMNLQIREQTINYMKALPIDNYIDLSALNKTELNNLKTVLSSLSSFQSRIKYDFGIGETK